MGFLQAFGAALLLVVAVAGPAEAKVVSLKELRERGVIRQHWDISCGAAALATLLVFQHDDPVTEAEIARAMLHNTDPNLVRQREGFSLLDLKKFVTARGYHGDGYGEMTLADLDGMAPAIVPINAGGYNHFVVYRGRIGDWVVLADPAFGNRSMAMDQFQSQWELRMAFVVERPGTAHTMGQLAPRTDDIPQVAAALLRRIFP